MKPTYGGLAAQLANSESKSRELAREAGDLLDMWEKRVAEGKPVPPVRLAIAPPAAEHGRTLIQLLFAKYNQLK